MCVCGGLEKISILKKNVFLKIGMFSKLGKKSTNFHWDWGRKFGPLRTQKTLVPTPMTGFQKQKLHSSDSNSCGVKCYFQHFSVITQLRSLYIAQEIIVIVIAVVFNVTFNIFQSSPN